MIKINAKSSSSLTDYAWNLAVKGSDWRLLNANEFVQKARALGVDNLGRNQSLLKSDSIVACCEIPVELANELSKPFNDNIMYIENAGAILGPHDKPSTFVSLKEYDKPMATVYINAEVLAGGLEFDTEKGKAQAWLPDNLYPEVLKKMLTDIISTDNISRLDGWNNLYDNAAKLDRFHTAVERFYGNEFGLRGEGNSLFLQHKNFNALCDKIGVEHPNEHKVAYSDWWEARLQQASLQWDPAKNQVKLLS